MKANTHRADDGDSQLLTLLLTSCINFSNVLKSCRNSASWEDIKENVPEANQQARLRVLGPFLRFLSFFPPQQFLSKNFFSLLTTDLARVASTSPLHQRCCTCFCSVFSWLHSLSSAVMSVQWAFLIWSALACTSSPRVSKMRAVGPGGPLIRGRRLRSPPVTSGEGRADSTSDQC